jgi:NAD(P)-dependent dehydrogenase (short-subunit alcohol dehydrogenase family)
MKAFADKIAIVTGGGMGLGRALCNELAAQGATVVVADIKADKAKAVADQIVLDGGHARAEQVDVSDADAIARVIDETAADFGRVDVMINNAGIAIGGDSRDLSIEQWERVLAVDLHGVVYGALAAYRAMARQGHGNIVNISSLGGLVPQPGNLPYSTSKWGVVGFSLGLRFEGADLGVKVSCVCPGDMKTDIYENMVVVNMDRDEIVQTSRRSHFLFPQWSAERAAREILRGAARNDAMIVFPRVGRVAWRLFRYCPDLIYWVTRIRVRMFRKVRDNYLSARRPT